MIDDTQIEYLASQIVAGTVANKSYLRMLVTACKEVMYEYETYADTVTSVHSRFYAAVLRGVGGTDLAPAERNRRATFARTSASTLLSFVNAGGDLAVLDVDTVSKARLRKASLPPEAENKAERLYYQARSVLLKAFKRLEKSDLLLAKDQLGELVDDLRSELRRLNKVDKLAQTYSSHILATQELM